MDKDNEILQYHGNYKSWHTLLPIRIIGPSWYSWAWGKTEKIEYAFIDTALYNTDYLYKFNGNNKMPGYTHSLHSWRYTIIDLFDFSFVVVTHESNQSHLAEEEEKEKIQESIPASILTFDIL